MGERDSQSRTRIFAYVKGVHLNPACSFLSSFRLSYTPADYLECQAEHNSRRRQSQLHPIPEAFPISLSPLCVRWKTSPGRPYSCVMQLDQPVLIQHTETGWIDGEQKNHISVAAFQDDHLQSILW